MSNLKREAPLTTKDNNATLLQGYGQRVELRKNPQALVRLSSHTFYQDLTWLKWLNNPNSGPATWHKHGPQPNDFSDVFVVYAGAHWSDNGEFSGDGSDYPSEPDRPGIPDHIYALIAEAVKEQTGSISTEALVWISYDPYPN